MGVAATEADEATYEAVASSVLAQIMGIPLKKLLVGVILIIFSVTSPSLILRSGYGHVYFMCTL